MSSTKHVYVGNVQIGGGAKITIQSMLNINANDIENSVLQAVALQNAGCDIIRIAIPNMQAINLIYALKSAVNIPVVADIHFDYKLALESVNAGIDKIRINPGNIGDESNVKKVANACKSKNIPIRIGVNSGSLEKNILKKYGFPTAEALCESAFYHVSLLNKFDFDDIVLSMKSSSVPTMVSAYELMAQKSLYPLHLGVTESGTERIGLMKSSAGIGSLLLHNIGDTIRISLTADPIKEIYAAKDLLRSLEITNTGINFISCPTCGRTQINLIQLANEVQNELVDCQKNITVAIMGCAVNGPGEAREADIGIAGGDKCGIIFKKGKILYKVKEEDILNALVQEIRKI